MDDQFQSSPSSLKTKLKSSICCFVGHPHDRHEALEPASPSSPAEKTPRMLRSSTMMCRNLISRLGVRSSRRHYYSTDFSYDPSSYALNFDDGPDDDCEPMEDCPLRNFSDRLPPSPSRSKVAPPAFAVACG